MKPMFTPEELAEMAAFDAEIENEPLTNEEIRESRERDRAALDDRKDKKEKKIAEGKRAYYAANKEKIAEAQRAYYAANKEKINAYMREYRRRRRLEDCKA